FGGDSADHRVAVVAETDQAEAQRWDYTPDRDILFTVAEIEEDLDERNLKTTNVSDTEAEAECEKSRVCEAVTSPDVQPGFSDEECEEIVMEKKGRASAIIAKRAERAAAIAANGSRGLTCKVCVI
ncbi:hypothetical protein PENTCL1PPCAC_28128, partial [Pristionchus entomophagus]